MGIMLLAVSVLVEYRFSAKKKRVLLNRGRTLLNRGVLNLLWFTYRVQLGYLPHSTFS
jgi:hypothetical protein